MGNMSYCRFRNTLIDLQDCYDNMGEGISDLEKIAKENLIELCKEIVEEFG